MDVARFSEAVFCNDFDSDSACHSQAFIAVKRHHVHVYSYKGKDFTGVDLQFGGLVHYYHGRKQDSKQADMVLERVVRVLHLDPQATGSDCHTDCGLNV